MTRQLKIIFPHLAKTGGTAMLYHFRKSIGDDKVVSFGPHSRCQRFFADQHQLEELPAEDRAKTQVVQGHGVDENTFALLGDPSFQLMVVLRGVVPLVRSRYNQRNIGAVKRGTTIDSKRFMESYRDNAVATALIELFPTFVDDPQADLKAQTVSLLRKFDFVYTTEQLGQQTVPMMQAHGLPTEIARRRVAGEAKVHLDVTDEDILARNAVDQAVFEAANQQLGGDGFGHNPFGFDPDGRAAALDRIMARRSDPETMRQTCYEELARALCKDLHGEAAMKKLEVHGDRVALADPAAFKPILERHLSEKLPGYSDAAREISAKKAQKWASRAVRAKARAKRLGKKLGMF